MSELPASWSEVEIGQIADVVSGGTPNANELGNFAIPGEGIAWLTPADLSGYTAKEISHGARDLSEQGYQSCSAKLMPKGSLLFSSRAPIGYVAVAANPISTNQGFKSFVFPDDVDSSYAFYYLKSIRSLADSLGTGTTFKELSGTAAKTLPFLMAPKAEQTRIAQKLDELLAQVDTLKARIDTIPALLKRFRQSVLAAAVSGRLTEEWRSSHPERPILSIEDLELGIKSSGFKTKAKGIGVTQVSAIPGWLDVPLGTVFSVKSGDGLTAKEMNENGKIPVYGGNGVNGHHTECNVTTRTVVIGRVGYYCGSVHFTPPQAWVTDNALIVSYPSTLFDINFVYWLLLGTNLRENTSSSAQPVISGEKIYPLNLSIPPLTEQVEIVRRIEQLFAFADQLEAKVATAQARIDRLTQSILAKAFRGELVPQDPNDEPASLLLERIQAQRAATPKAKRGRKASA